MAGISPEYYLRLEQGKDHQPSPQVLLALSRALRLDSDATDYLFRLAGQTVPSRPPRRSSATVDPSAAGMLDSVTTFLEQWTSAPAYVVDRNQDVLAVNGLGRCFIPLSVSPGSNMLEEIIEGAQESDGMPGADERKPYWDRAIRSATANLRFHGDPHDPRLRVLVASLSSRCPLFRDVWTSHEAHPQRRGVALVDIAPFGFIPFRWQTLEVPGGGQYLTTFFGDPGSPAAAAIEYLLAKAKVDQAIAGSAGGRPLPEELAETEAGDR
jgi:transcriptional regulator with XRE-family HTH domain